jgi:hypothetical protein
VDNCEDLYSSYAEIDKSFLVRLLCCMMCNIPRSENTTSDENRPLVPLGFSSVPELPIQNEVLPGLLHNQI